LRKLSLPFFENIPVPASTFTPLGPYCPQGVVEGIDMREDYPGIIVYWQYFRRINIMNGSGPNSIPDNYRSSIKSIYVKARGMPNGIWVNNYSGQACIKPFYGIICTLLRVGIPYAGVSDESKRKKYA